MIVKQKWNNLCIAQKMGVLKMKEENIPQCDISKRLGCSAAQVLRICRDPERVRNEAVKCKNKDCKWQQNGKNANVETSLRMWFADACARNVPVNTNILEEKSKQLATELGQTDFKHTSGWCVERK